MSDTPQDTVPEGLTEARAQELLHELHEAGTYEEANLAREALLNGVATLRRELAAAREEVERLKGLLAEVREDATGSVEGKRVWPIRAALHRRIAAELDNREVDAKTGFPKPAPDGEEATQGKED